MHRHLLIIFILSIFLVIGCSKDKTVEPEDEIPTESDFWIAQSVPSLVNSTAVDPQLTIWAGTDNGFYVKTKTGTSWDKRNAGLGTMINATLIKSSSIGDIYSIVGTDLYHFNSASGQWENISENLNTNLLTFDHMYTFSLDNNNILYAGMFVSEKPDPSSIAVDKPAFFKSSDKGLSWEKVKVKQFEGEVENISFDKSGNIYVIMDANIYISGDNGQTWKSSLHGILGKNPFLISSDSKNDLYCATGSGLYKSTDSGNTWNNANWETYCISLGVNSADKVFIGGINSGYYSQDSGGSWTEISSGLSYSLAGFSDCIIQTFDKDGYAYCILESVLYKSSKSTSAF